MGNDYSEELPRLTEACRAIFGTPSTWIEADGYPHSLALCVIDSIFSTGSSYQSVINVVRAYVAMRRAEGADPYKDGFTELLSSFERLGGSTGWAKAVNNHKPAHTKPGAMLKAEVVLRAVLALSALEGGPILTTADIHEEHAKDPHLKRVKKAWLKLPSQSSGVTFNYFLILAGFQSVKPDRMVIRFMTEHLGLRTRLSPMEAAQLITDIADLYVAEPRKLDHVIWRHTSKRQVFKL